ncbi:ArnT family glycosyltransferase [Phenylobacterium immobile]|uniref:ArnT family glycosyltransferase n=1 Tax=Phenylobacterium immobile TaxID=21 RepID=UPI000A4C3583|nr:glycosyltransferase family 39 protein [Phenylobacterium immobile]
MRQRLMPGQNTATGAAESGEGELRLVWLLIIALAAARLIALFATPLELYPDEAQYWAWSRDLAFGYFSKPPLIAWAIRATTALGGDSEPWVRLSFGLFQAGATLLAFFIGRRLYGPTTGLVAATLYALAPGVQLSALVAATDAPLLFFLAAALLAYIRQQQPEARLTNAAAAGAALGLAFLSKYAALYALVGVALHLTLAPSARRAWRPGALLAAIGALGVVIAPNLLWNFGHDLATVRHTADNADWAASRFNPLEALQFVAAQFGVIGPIPFGALLVGAGLGWRKRLHPQDMLLACFVVPPLLIVTAQAFISRANANWAAACVLPAAVLAAAWLVRWGAKGWIIAAIASQALVAAAFLAIVTQPMLADRLGASNGFKRARGWEETTAAILDRAEREAGLTSIAVNNRFLFYALTYYGRDRLAAAPPLASWLLASEARNQAETAAPLDAALGHRALLVSYEGWWRPQMEDDFSRTEALGFASIGLDAKHRRRIEMFIGEGFQPKPRDPRTGLPVSAATTPP